ncbi:MAG TPA: carboxymuconolactone decarboxylase family protein [Gemmatimonadales bacterium]|nr:carboxymuconolactone decarboxylase family protein [Gemmatimonadales bacterium]
MTGHELALVRLAAAVAQGGDERLERALAGVQEAQVPAEMVDEAILMAIVAVGFPRTLIAMRAWRKVSGERSAVSGSAAGSDYRRHEEWTREGEATCRIVYGANYERLRETVRQLHPDLDGWMITEGYGRTLSRPGLTLRVRELLMVAMCAVLDVPHQLHSHLKGALHAGASATEVGDTLDAVLGNVSPREQEQAWQLWRRVVG